MYRTHFQKIIDKDVGSKKASEYHPKIVDSWLWVYKDV